MILKLRNRFLKVTALGMLILPLPALSEEAKLNTPLTVQPSIDVKPVVDVQPKVETIPIRGLLKPLHEATLSSEILATIEELPVKEGKHF